LLSFSFFKEDDHQEDGPAIATRKSDMTYETEDRRDDASHYFVLFSALLALVIILSRLLHGFPALNSVFSEASLVLTVGLITGFFAHNFVQYENDQTYMAGGGEEMREDMYRVATSLLSFSPNVFFMALLPPILFNSGYQLRRELFYRHIKPIVMFACLGTLLSALTAGFSLYGVLKLGWMGDFNPTLLELLTFGSLIAATDTVSVLAVFQKKRVDPHLFYLVFGESALNDAVALVVFKTFASLTENLDGRESFTYAKAAALFIRDVIIQGIGSPSLGILFGFAAALIFKHMDFRELPNLELPLYLVLLLYVPFIAAECLHLSGIVTIFFCGISARRYVTPNISESTVNNAASIFKVCAYLAETVIFLELGLSVFGLASSFQWKFIFWAFAAALLGRAIGIYPLAFLHNFTLKERVEVLHLEDSLFADANAQPGPTSDRAVESPGVYASSPKSPSLERKLDSKKRKTPLRRKDKQISRSMMHVLWFAGLRGAVAYACVRDFPDILGHRDEFIAATVVIVLGTIIGMGGATESLLRYLQVTMDVNEDDYMEEWYKTKELRGTFHYFGKYGLLEYLPICHLVPFLLFH
jgi:sodium/hydrogen exchanger 8